jgi:hypothetical protein
MNKFYPPQALKIKEVMRSKNYSVFGSQKGYDLNIFGIRTKDMESNKFNDWIGVMWLYHDVWNMLTFPATTDPGSYWRKNPMNVNGTALLKPGQYKGAYILGKHGGKYDALVQQGNEVTVYRDADRDNILEPDENETMSGYFGINIHRASSLQPSENVNKWSAGCQVIQDPIQFKMFMDLVKKSSEIYGNKFTYTLLTEEDFN